MVVGSQGIEFGGDMAPDQACAVEGNLGHSTYSLAFVASRGGFGCELT